MFVEEAAAMQDMLNAAEGADFDYNEADTEYGEITERTRELQGQEGGAENLPEEKSEEEKTLDMIVSGRGGKREDYVKTYDSRETNENYQFNFETGEILDTNGNPLVSAPEASDAYRYMVEQFKQHPEGYKHLLSELPEENEDGETIRHQTVAHLESDGTIWYDTHTIYPEKEKLPEKNDAEEDQLPAPEYNSEPQQQNDAELKKEPSAEPELVIDMNEVLASADAARGTPEFVAAPAEVSKPAAAEPVAEITSVENTAIMAEKPATKASEPVAAQVPAEGKIEANKAVLEAKTGVKEGDFEASQIEPVKKEAALVDAKKEDEKSVAVEARVAIAVDVVTQTPEIVSASAEAVVEPASVRETAAAVEADHVPEANIGNEIAAEPIAEKIIQERPIRSEETGSNEEIIKKIENEKAVASQSTSMRRSEVESVKNVVAAEEAVAVPVESVAPEIIARAETVAPAEAVIAVEPVEASAPVEVVVVNDASEIAAPVKEVAAVEPIEAVKIIPVETVADAVQTEATPIVPSAEEIKEPAQAVIENEIAKDESVEAVVPAEVAKAVEPAPVVEIKPEGTAPVAEIKQVEEKPVVAAEQVEEVAEQAVELANKSAIEPTAEPEAIAKPAEAVKEIRQEKPEVEAAKNEEPVAAAIPSEKSTAPKIEKVETAAKPVEAIKVERTEISAEPALKSEAVIKAEPEVMQKVEVKAELKIEHKPEIKAEPKTETAAVVSSPAITRDSRVASAENRSEIKAEETIAAPTEIKIEMKNDSGKAVEKVADKTAAVKAEPKAEPKTEQKPEQKTEPADTAIKSTSTRRSRVETGNDEVAGAVKAAEAVNNEEAVNAEAANGETAIKEAVSVEKSVAAKIEANAEIEPEAKSEAEKTVAEAVQKAPETSAVKAMEIAREVLEKPAEAKAVKSEKPAANNEVFESAYAPVVAEAAQGRTVTHERYVPLSGHEIVLRSMGIPVESRAFSNVAESARNSSGAGAAAKAFTAQNDEFPQNEKNNPSKLNGISIKIAA